MHNTPCLFACPWTVWWLTDDDDDAAGGYKMDLFFFSEQPGPCCTQQFLPEEVFEI